MKWHIFNIGMVGSYPSMSFCTVKKSCANAKIGWCFSSLYRRILVHSFTRFQVHSSNRISNCCIARNANYSMPWCHDDRPMCIPFSKMRIRREEVSSCLLWHLPNAEDAMQNRFGRYCFGAGKHPVEPQNNLDSSPAFCNPAALGSMSRWTDSGQCGCSRQVYC